MNRCEDFEGLMADALGDELAPADRSAFEAHLAQCAQCRQEYESLRQTVGTMRDLPGPTRVSVRREGSRLVIDEKEAAAPRRRVWWVGSPLRYAASILIAFTAGYALHAGLVLTADKGPVQLAVTDGDEGTTGPGTADRDGAGPATPRAVPSPSTLERALLNTHARQPSRSGLAKCLIAMANAKG
jgi:hypothetical protein